MTEQRREIRNAITGALSEIADDVFLAFGFTRRLTTLQYEREFEGGVQHVNVSLEHSPKDNPRAAAVIYPWVSVKIDDIETILVKMLAGHDDLLTANGATLNQPIEWLSPKGEGARWHIYQPDSVACAIREFVAFSQKWVFPFLADYADASNVVAMYEKKDERVINVVGQSLRIVAAMVRLRNLDGAMNVLEERFGRPALRRKYGPMFEFVQNNLADSSNRQG